MNLIDQSLPWRWYLSANVYYRWLVARGSLTRRIRRRCPDLFSVRAVCYGAGRLSRAEARQMGIRAGSSAWWREVYLYCGDTPLVFASSMLPVHSLCGRWRDLRRLGTQPLGERLFTNTQVRRAPLRFKSLTSRHALYRRAVRGLPNQPSRLWARRSVFRLHDRPILVTEVFLPAILDL